MTLPKKDLEDSFQRYLDSELTQEEKEKFFGSLTEHEREEVFNTENALLALDALPRVAAPASLMSNVMASIAPKRPSLAARARSWLENHPLLGWQVGGMAVAASVLFMVVSPQMQAPASFTVVAQNSCQQVATANPASVGHATFCLYAPHAHNVALVGDFNGWGSEQRVQLHQQKNAALWIAEVPLSPGSYQYAFVIDDKKMVTDPAAEQHVNDDFGRKNAVITVI
jgi:hypothetical protein